MAKYSEYRKISMDKVRELCIKYDFYTCGDCLEYDNLLWNLVGYHKLTTNRAIKIATDIKNHSDTSLEIIDIAEILINNSTVRIFEN